MFELRDELLLFLNENNGTLSQFLTDEMWIAILTYLRVWHTLKLLLALQGTVATCKARFGGLIDISFVTKFFWHFLLKSIQLDGTCQTCCTQ